jgi:hypothetical protein
MCIRLATSIPQIAKDSVLSETFYESYVKGEEPPDIKHHRIPAPGLSFDSPNLIFLIREIEALLPSA